MIQSLALGALISPKTKSTKVGESYPYNARKGVIPMDMWKVVDPDYFRHEMRAEI
jgi:hypothetical protein